MFWDENDTSRYEGHYRYEQAYKMIGKRVMITTGHEAIPPRLLHGSLRTRYWTSIRISLRMCIVIGIR